MSFFTFNDYVFSSEEDEPQHDDLFEGKSTQGDLEVENAIMDLDQYSDDDEVADQSIDSDEYATFHTDRQKYNYDQLRWDAIPNVRKYTITKGTRKGRQGRDQDETRVEAKSTQNTSSEKQEKPKALPKSKNEGKNKRGNLPEPAAEITKEGEIHFDARDNLWYSHQKNGVYLSERATFHHWVRPGLSESENAKGTYDFPRQRHAGNWDITCYNEVQQHWGLERPHYAPVMFEWERLNRKDPKYPLDSLYYQELLVIDYWRTPVRNFREIPLVISSAFEGGFMEPATRIHSQIAYEDMRARMPPFLEVIKKGHPIRFKPLSKASTFSGRSRHFRENAGAISWQKREGSANIKEFIADIVKPMNNSTLGSRDLSKAEVKQLRLMNGGTKPTRAKPGTTKESREKYIAGIRKGAGITAATVSPPTANDQNGGEQELDDGGEDVMMADGHDQPEPMDHTFSAAENLDDNRQELETEDEVMWTQGVAHQDPSDPDWMTFCMNTYIDLSDDNVDGFVQDPPAPLAPEDINQQAPQRALTFEPVLYEGSNYISESCNMQDQMDERVNDQAATALRGFKRWE